MSTAVRELRCGRSEPVLHLLEADDSLTRPNWRVGSQDHVALCGAQVTEETPVPDYEDCPGCPDCTRYCARCVRVASATVAELDGPSADNGTSGADNGATGSRPADDQSAAVEPWTP